VQILPFDTEKFEYTPDSPNLDKDNDTETVLQSYPVTIATVNGSGPIPTAFTVEHQRPRQENNELENMFLQCGSGIKMRSSVNHGKVDLSLKYR
jgi:hypothetical protein